MRQVRKGTIFWETQENSSLSSAAMRHCPLPFEAEYSRLVWNMKSKSTTEWILAFSRVWKPIHLQFETAIELCRCRTACHLKLWGEKKNPSFLHLFKRHDFSYIMTESKTWFLIFSCCSRSIAYKNVYLPMMSHSSSQTHSQCLGIDKLSCSMIQKFL